MPASRAMVASTSNGLQQAQTSGAFGAFSQPARTSIDPTPHVQPGYAPADTAVDDYDVVNVAETDPHSQAPMAEGSMSIKSSTLSTSFTVEGKATIQSDGAGHTVPIASIACSSTIKRICVPRLSTNVYLQCRVENSTEYKLLAGNVNVFLDEEYVSKSVIKVCLVHL